MRKKLSSSLKLRARMNNTKHNITYEDDSLFEKWISKEELEKLVATVYYGNNFFLKKPLKKFT